MCPTIHAYMHFFIHSAFIKHLLCARDSSRHWKPNSEQSKQNFSHWDRKVGGIDKSKSICMTCLKVINAEKEEQGKRYGGYYVRWRGQGRTCTGQRE